MKLIELNKLEQLLRSLNRQVFGYWNFDDECIGGKGVFYEKEKLFHPYPLPPFGSLQPLPPPPSKKWHCYSFGGQPPTPPPKKKKKKKNPGKVGSHPIPIPPAPSNHLPPPPPPPKWHCHSLVALSFVWLTWLKFIFCHTVTIISMYT